MNTILLVQLTSTTAVAEFARDFIGDNDRETLIVIGINTKSAINFISIASIGSLNATVATPREIFKTAIIRNCSRIILAHNHPSYNQPFPSRYWFYKSDWKSRRISWDWITRPCYRFTNQPFFFSSQWFLKQWRDITWVMNHLPLNG